MSVFAEILKDFMLFYKRILRLLSSYSKTKISIVLAIVLALIITSYYILKPDNLAYLPESDSLPNVKVLAVSEFNTTSSFNTIGKVEAVSEANLKTEAGGRITNVFVKIGDNVSAGTIIASIENNSQRASLLQAEGAYEAAQAGASSGNLSIAQAENNVKSVLNAASSANRTTYNTANSVILGTIDQFYSNPVTGLIGLRVNGNTEYLNLERIAFREVLSNWQNSTNFDLNESNVLSQIDFSITQIKRLKTFVENFEVITSNAKKTDTLNNLPLSSYNSELQQAQSILNNSLNTLTNVRTNYVSSLDSLEQAKIGGSSSSGSLANAQVKIALGSLRAAQANYDKTLVRTPISGVVNALYLKTGDYVSASQPAAIIANNNGLEINTYVNENSSVNINVGDKVIIEGNLTGVIAAKAAALDPTTGKIAITISVDANQNITNGSTVTVTFSQTPTGDKNVTKIFIPLASIKLTSTGANIFEVATDSTLISHSVELGTIDGDKVEIISGLTPEMSIVTDSRGLTAGLKVSVISI